MKTRIIILFLLVQAVGFANGTIFHISKKTKRTADYGIPIKIVSQYAQPVKVKLTSLNGINGINYLLQANTSKIINSGRYLVEVIGPYGYGDEVLAQNTISLGSVGVTINITRDACVYWHYNNESAQRRFSFYLNRACMSGRPQTNTASNYTPHKKKPYVDKPQTSRSRRAKSPYRTTSNIREIPSHIQNRPSNIHNTSGNVHNYSRSNRNNNSSRNDAYKRAQKSSERGRRRAEEMYKRGLERARKMAEKAAKIKR